MEEYVVTAVRGGRICTRRGRSKGAIYRLGDKDQAQKEPERRLHLSSEHLACCTGR